MRPSPASRPAALAALLASVLAGLAGCTTRPDLAPHPLRLVPAGGPAGAEATVIIEGTGFLARASQAASGGLAALETTHAASLDGVALTGVTWLDAGRLRATIPAGLGLGPGPHALTVVNAHGLSGTLAAAWTVLDPAALKVSVAAPGTALVGGPFTLTVTVENSGGTALRGVRVAVTPSGAGPVGGDLATAAFDLEPGATRVLELTLTASTAGIVSLGVAAEGREVATGRAVAGAGPGTSLLVQAPASLLLTAVPEPLIAVVGQAITLAVTATNPGGTALRGVAVSIAPSGVGLVTGDLAAASFDLDPGATRELRLALTAAAAGPVALGVAAAGTEDLGGRVVTGAAAPASLLVQAPALLALAATAPARVVAGQPFTLTVTASNPGGTVLLGVAVAVAPSVAGVAGDLAPASFDLAPGATRELRLALTAAAAGPVALGVTAGASEDLGGRPVSGAATPAPVLVQAPAALSVSATLAPSQASVGQAVTLTVTASNGGGSAVTGLSVTASPSGAGAVTGPLAPAPFDLAPGATRRLDLPLAASAAGAVALAVAAEGREELGDRVVGAAAPDAALLVQTRAALTAALAVPSTIPAGAAFQVTMTVVNDGQAAAEVTPGALQPAAGATGSFSLVSGPVPASALAPGGGQATFSWTWQLGGAGTVQLVGGAAGVDANDGGPVVAAPALSNQGDQLPELAAVATDPLGDGTPVAALAVRDGLLYVGPGRGGSAFWRLAPSTGASAVLGVEIAVDTGGSRAANSAWRASPPATTFGAAGCAANTTGCGPNNENGRGLLASGAFAGDEWLLYTGAIVKGARYLYASRQDASPLPFASVDLGVQLSDEAVAPTAIAFAPAVAGGADRLYAAFTEKRADHSPQLVALSRAPTIPVLDAATPADAQELAVTTAAGVGGNAGPFSNPDDQPRIEAMAWFRDRLYLATGHGLLRSTVPAPRPYASNGADWSGATPFALQWLLRSPLPATASAGLTPADRSVPAMAAFGACGAGPCLYLARNVTGTSPGVVPQLWRCDPTLGGDAAACDPGDWSLSAPNASGDPSLTQLGDATNGPVSLLVATSKYLYLGFDNATTGVQVYRTGLDPASRLDFHGRNGCAASTAGCQGLGGNGLGLGSAVTRIFDAKAVTSGGVTTVYLAAGDGTGPLRLFALSE